MCIHIDHLIFKSLQSLQEEGVVCVRERNVINPNGP